METNNREISRRVFEEVWNDKNLDAIDELIANDYVHHDPQSPPVSTGAAAYKGFVTYYLSAFPDLRFTLEEELSDEDTVVTRWTATGTHNGLLYGVSGTGRHFSVTGITIARIRNGKAVESWNNWDSLGLMQQLGIVSTEARGQAA